VPMLQFLDIKCKVLHSGPIFRLRLQEAASLSPGWKEKAAGGEMLTCNNNRFSRLALSTCDVPLRFGQTISREPDSVGRCEPTVVVRV
jgi:hypothetical protein